MYTLDADIVLVAQNLPDVQTELQAMGFQLGEFERPVNATRPASELSIQFTLDERYQGFPARAVQSEVFGTKVPVACLEDLVKGKVWAWSDTRRRASKRKKDELDILRLAEAFAEIRPFCPASILAELDQ